MELGLAGEGEVSLSPPARTFSLPPTTHWHRCLHTAYLCCAPAEWVPCLVLVSDPTSATMWLPARGILSHKPAADLRGP